MKKIIAISMLTGCLFNAAAQQSQERVKPAPEVKKEMPAPVDAGKPMVVPDKNPAALKPASTVAVDISNTALPKPIITHEAPVAPAPEQKEVKKSGPVIDDPKKHN
jgi:hypothetical protein